ncbi:FAR1-related sequence 5-like protein [Tanacetum coccineum]
MVVIDDHDMIDTSEGLIPRDVFDVGEGSIPRDVQDVNIESTEGQEQIDVSDIELYRNDPDFAPTPKGIPCTLRRAGSTSVGQGSNDTREGDVEDGEKDGKRKRQRKTVSKVTNCLAKIGLKAIHGTECYKLFDFVENHNHLLINENNMDLSRARRQLHFGYYIFIHRASLSNIGPTLAHRLKVALMGGYDKVRGTPDDYRKFKRVVNLFTRDRDAQMIVDKIINRQHHVPEFSFEHHVLHDETHKYAFVFVPFTGIDHNKKCVTFGAALLSGETEDSYCWMLEAFLKVHRKQPPLALTDQDAALRNVVVKMFPDSNIGYVLGDLETDSEFRKEIPEPYINRRWTKNTLPTYLLEKRHKYGPCIEETDRLAAEVHATIEDCAGLIRNNTNKLTQFLTKIKEMKKQLEDEIPQSNYDHNNEALYDDFLGVTVPEQVVIKNPKKSSNKGSKRRKSAAEEGKAKRKLRTTRKVPFKQRTCSKCGGKGHNMRGCKKRKTTKPTIDDEDKVVGEDEVDEEDDVQQVDAEDEVQEVDEDYESDEDASDEDESDED